MASASMPNGEVWRRLPGGSLLTPLPEWPKERLRERLSFPEYTFTDGPVRYITGYLRQCKFFVLLLITEKNLPLFFLSELYLLCAGLIRNALPPYLKINGLLLTRHASVITGLNWRLNGYTCFLLSGGN
jgi:hypothetical protein